MKSICIKTNSARQIDYLLKELREAEIESICFGVRNFKHYENVIIHYKGKNLNEFYSLISTMLSFLVIDELEEEFLKRSLFSEYFYFDLAERKKILNICNEVFADDFPNLFNKRFSTLYNSFLKYISSHRNIVLQGVVQFRTKGYLKILNDVVQEAVNIYIIEKEYNEFISLLKLYINSQPSLTGVVHMVYSSSECVLLDENKEIIGDDKNAFDLRYLSDITFSANDYTLNSLLNLLPKRIYVHLIDNYTDEFINTIQSVFENRVQFCNDCGICRVYKQRCKTNRFQE